VTTITESCRMRLSPGCEDDISGDVSLQSLQLWSAGYRIFASTGGSSVAFALTSGSDAADSTLSPATHATGLLVLRAFGILQNQRGDWMRKLGNACRSVHNETYVASSITMDA
jgi:hypothetical protein